VKVIDEVMKGVSPHAGIEGIGWGKKIRRIVRRPALAVADLDRQFLASADCIALSRDESKGRLVVRFTAGRASDLATREGMFGQARFAGSSGQAIADATGQMLQEMATPLSLKPGGLKFKGAKVEVDQQLYNDLRLKVEMLSVDSASNETLAANIMRRPELRRNHEELITPNLKVLARDKAHGMRRPLVCVCEVAIPEPVRTPSRPPVVTF
jgi:hypothetical protein